MESNVEKESNNTFLGPVGFQPGELRTTPHAFLVFWSRYLAWHCLHFLVISTRIAIWLEHPRQGNNKIDLSNTDTKMPHREPASPSPPPEAPIASTPGPRAARLQKVFAGALSSSIKANSYANFSACFPTPATYCPTALEGVWKQLNARLEEECTRDFEKILEERSVVEGLNQWDSLIEEARQKKDRSTGEGPGRPLHTLSGEELYAAHLTPFLQHAAIELASKLCDTQRQNQIMMDNIAKQRQEIQALVQGMDGVARDIEGSVAAMNDADDRPGMRTLRDDIFEMEQELAATR
jgi:kinetochore protein NNF1